MNELVFSFGFNFMFKDNCTENRFGCTFEFLIKNFINMHVSVRVYILFLIEKKKTAII